MRYWLNGLFTLILCGFTGCGDAPVAPPSARSSAPKAEPQADLLLRVRLAGTTALATNASTVKLNEFLALPASEKLRDQVVEKLAQRLVSVAISSTNGLPIPQVAAVRLRLAEGLRAASQFELYDAPDSPVWRLTMQLDEAAAKFWQDTFRETSLNTNSQRTFSFARMGTTLMLDFDVRSKSILPPKNSAPKSNGDTLLEIEANVPKLARWLEWPTNFPLMSASIAVLGRTNALRTDARLQFAQPLAASLPAWQWPTNSVRDPLISFTVARGFTQALLTQFFQPALGLEFDQYCAWANSDIPFQTFVALPQAKATAQMDQFGARWPELLASKVSPGKLAYITNRHEIIWQGLPLLLPFVRPAPEKGDNFLLFGTMGGLVPQGVNTNPPPRELLAELNKTNLVYYDWEITEMRLQQWRQTLQLLQMLSLPAMTTNVPAARVWLDTLGPKLGNAVTEVTRVSATEWRLVRQSHIGLTGIELALLGRWLDNPAFPAFAYPEAPSMLPPLPGAPARKAP